ncbi:MAG: hypothetical protein HZC28_19545 [Spirochaetes bacterium]|nr:hypothetical protein [Spirochaetota bacterium]
MTKSNMYADAKTWSPSKGCEFDCTYCVPSFQRQAKRQKHICMKCYRYTPHTHPERLLKVPNAKIVFACGNGDIAFAEPEYLFKIVEAIRVNSSHSHKEKTFYLQSKKPSCMQPILKLLPENVILITTLETNRDEGYNKVTKAPVPSERYNQFLELDYPRKVVTIEPAMDFDVDIFGEWITNIKPEYVWLGYNSKDSVQLPEPSPEKMKALAALLEENNIPVHCKTLRGIEL